MSAGPQQNPSVVIRPAIASDVPAITEIYNDAIRTTTATFDTETKTVAEQRKWFAAHGPRHPVLVAEIADKVVGWAALSPWSGRCAYADTAETSFYVAPAYRKQGIGRQLKRATIEAARAVGLHTLLARVAEGSGASLHLNREFGFREVGVMREVGRKFGRRLNVHLLQLMLDDDAAEDAGRSSE